MTSETSIFFSSRMLKPFFKGLAALFILLGEAGAELSS